MADGNAASPAQNATPAAGAPAPEGQATPAAEAPKESESKKLDRQIDRALKKGRAELKAKEGTPPRGAGGRFQKSAPAAAETTGEPGETKAPAGETKAPAAETKPAKPEPVSGKTPRELLDAGDLDGAFEAAFGKKPQDFKVDSRKWEELRKYGQRQKAKLAEREATSNAKLEADRAELGETLTQAKKELGPLLEARKLFAAKDYVGAINKAFGVDAPTLQKLLLSQFHGKNPEVEQLRRELAERDARDSESRQRADAEQRQATERQQVQAFVEQIRTEMIDGSDPTVAAMATKPRFVQRVLQIMQQHYDPATRTRLPTSEAAAMALEEVRAEFGPLLGVAPRDTAVPVESVQPGSKAAPSGRGRAPTTSLPQRGAAEARLPGQRLSAQQTVDKYTNLARAEAGLS